MEQQDVSSDYSLTEVDPMTLPHFEDETTLQSARPVVPLHEVRKESRAKHRLLLGAALFAAAAVGALTASLVYDHQAQPNQNLRNSDSLASAGFVAPSGETSGDTVNPNEAVTMDTEVTAASDSDGDSGHNEPAPSKLNQAQVETARVTKHIQQNRRERQAESRVNLNDQQQRRNDVHQLRRERRVNAGRPQDDLTRIREIFEGSPRP